MAFQVEVFFLCHWCYCPPRYVALFSGLTLGLLALDPVTLKIVAKGDTTNAKYAEKIMPIRAKGNRLLCTLLLGNVAVNCALSILLAQSTNWYVGFVLATMLIVIFGEIVPQAACSRYALWIGSGVIGIVRVLIIFLAPLAWPISRILDKLLGDELGLVYTDRELRNLVEVHNKQGDLPTISAGIMQGALDFSKLTVESVMTEWKSVFFLNSDAKLDFDTLERIFKSGHSRVPVMEVRSSMFHGTSQQVIGLLFVKDLILLDPEDELPIVNIIDTFHHDLKHIDYSTSVKTVMDEFRHGRSHLAIVRKPTTNNAGGQLIYENVGIVTLEDIIENILKMEIEDEFDVNPTIRESTRKDEILQLFDYRRTRGMDGMPPQERIVVYRHLSREVKVFTPEFRRVEDVDLQNLLASGSVYKVLSDNWRENVSVDTSPIISSSKDNQLVEEGGYLLYQQGVQTEHFTFILDGKAEVFSGRQKFRSEVSRFSILCPALLEQTQHDFLAGLELSAFVPDFTSRVIQNSRILRISRENFVKCLQGKLRKYCRPQKEIREKMQDIFRRSQRFPSLTSEISTHTQQAQLTNEMLNDIMVEQSPLKSPQPIIAISDLSVQIESPRQRQRYYDETYLGHESEMLLYNQSPTNTQRSVLKKQSSYVSQSQVSLVDISPTYEINFRDKMSSEKKDFNGETVQAPGTVAKFITDSSETVPLITVSNESVVQ